jgi:hypothetical protein
MMMTAVEIGHARPARSPETKAAIKYLEASGATAISVIEADTGCTFRVGTKIDPHPPDSAINENPPGEGPSGAV